MAPGARNKFSALMFETKVYWEEMYCTEENTCNIVGTFRRPGHSASIVPSLRPWFSCSISVLCHTDLQVSY